MDIRERGINDRIADARVLWGARRRGSAILLALVAVAARGKRDLPQVTGDRRNFLETLNRAHTWRIEVEFRGRLLDTDSLLYEHLRCMLAHEAHLPADIVVDDALGEGLAIRAAGGDDATLRLSPGWFDFLCRVAATPIT